MRMFLEKVSLLLLGLAAGFILAEGLSAFFLPRPLHFKSPVLRMEADPGSGYRYRPDQEGFTLESRAVINHLGFRGPSRKVVKDTGVIRIALLGDSYVFGQGVGEEETAAAQLEKKLNAEALDGTRYEVLNFGMSGYDTGHEIKVLERYALDFQPDVVFLCFFLNDLFYIKDYAFYPRMLEKERREFSPLKWALRNLCRRSRLIMAGWDFLKGFSLRKNETLQTLHAYAIGGVIPPAGPGEEGWKFTLERLGDFKRLADQHRFEAVLAVVPTPEEIMRGKSAPYAAFLLEEGAKSGIRPVDLFHGFERAGLRTWKKWMIPYDYHFNGNGNRIWSEVFSAAVRDLYPAAGKP